MASKFLDELEDAVAPARARLFDTKLIRGLLGEETLPLSVWKAYLWESYHYVKHNGINQALAVLRTDVTEKKLMQRYLRHAIEEIDHDEMCLRDLEALGVSRQEVIGSRPLPETAAFSSFLYDFVMRDNPIGRLGYSYWAEGTNQYAELIVARLRHHFALKDEQMSFVLEHADLDRGHAKACERTIDEHAQTEADREAIKYFAVATCHQFYYVLEALYERGVRER